MFEAHRKIARELLMRHLVAVLGLTLDVEVLAFESHGAFFDPRQLMPRTKGKAGQTVSETRSLKNIFPVDISNFYVATLLRDSTRIR